MRVNVGQAKTDLSKLIARVEAGEDVEIARGGQPVVRLVRIDPASGPGARFLAAAGSLAGKIGSAGGNRGAEELRFSAVSFAEIGVKAAIGKLVVPDDLHEHVLRSGLRILPLAPEHALAVAGLPMHHQDPFDRLLIAQARLEGLHLVTADPRFAAYDVAVVEAAA
jgi:prevent-host-death family protein